MSDLRAQLSIVLPTVLYVQKVQGDCLPYKLRIQLTRVIHLRRSHGHSGTLSACSCYRGLKTVAKVQRPHSTNATSPPAALAREDHTATRF